MKYFCVISHTHWDREWYMPFEQFRLRLVELIDRLIIILEKNPEYIFHLDAQTIVLEDYFEIRPSKREILKDYIAKGRIVVGPWYLQNDFYLTSGESTVRNLLIGTKIANEFGACGKAGYAPDQFGNISQLPQILNNFGIDNFIFGRGFGKYKKDENGTTVREKTPTEFIWRGADGTEVLAIHMKYWYNNAQRLSSNMDIAMPLIGNIEKMFEDIAVTPYLLLMNGVDHLEAQDDIIDVIDEINSRLPADKRVKQYSMDEYINNVKNYIEDNDVKMYKHEGELRDGHDWELLKGTLSSRHYLKVSNVKAQNMLEHRLEPMYSLYEMAGAEGVYAEDHMHYLWKQLLKNHPHDSICGCSRDEVHAHMEDNYAKLNEAGDYLLNKLAEDIAFHAEINSGEKDDNILALINTTQICQNGVTEAEIIFLASEKVKGFTVTDKDGNNIDFAVKSIENRKQDVFSALNLPGVLDVVVYTVYLNTENVNAYSVKGLLVKKAEGFNENTVLEQADSTIMDNGILRVEVGADATVDITSYKTGQNVKNAINLEETCDRGDSYVYFKSDDKPNYGTDFPVAVKSIENNRFVQKCSVLYNMEVPEHYDFDSLRRSDNKVVCPVELILTLKKGSEVIEIEYNVDNRAKDHRIRLLVDTNIISDISVADIPFDMVYRPAELQYPDTMSDVYANTSFAAIGDNSKGVCVFTEGAHEYEHLKDEKAVLAFTLVRSTGVISRGGNLKSTGGRQWVAEQNQCIRKISGRVGIYLYSGCAEELPVIAQAFRNPVMPVFVSCDRKKYAGGRHAVQGSSVVEFYYLPDLYEDIRLKDNASLLDIKGEGVLVTALKKAENGDGFILRVVNMKAEDNEVILNIKGNVYKTNMSEDKKELLGADSVSYRLKGKEIATFMLK